MSKNKKICSCFKIYKEDLKNLIKEKKLTTIKSVENECKAGSKCGKCLKDIEKIIKKQNEKQE